MISASKSTVSLKNLKIVRPKVTKNLTNLHKKFCESPPRDKWVRYFSLFSLMSSCLRIKRWKKKVKVVWVEKSVFVTSFALFYTN